MRSQKAFTVPRVGKPGFPITLHLRCTKCICSVLLHHPNPFRKRRAERTQLHLQRRRRKFRQAPKKSSAVAFSLPPTPHPIRSSSSSLPSPPPSSSPFIKYLLHAKFRAEHAYYIIPSSLQLCEGVITIPISQREKLRIREVTTLSKSTQLL